jgi:2,3-bisphosphoglycerate-dependent phosphoglycerate mutase
MRRHLLLVRHGQSSYNAINRFTGWLDPELTELGEHEAHVVADKLRASELVFSIVFSSALLRAQRTAEIILDDLGAMNVPVVADSALNERDYGQLAGLDKDEARNRWGDAQIHQWRRSYLDGPPGGESLRDTTARVLPFYLQSILPVVMRGANALVVAHGNSLRALMMVLDRLSPEAITTIEIQTGEVLSYQLAIDTIASRNHLLTG